jgi:flagellar biosynthesis/type III secretory pathway M-ring protein FliF/YscJ
MLLGENWQQIIGWIDIYQNVVLVILALLVLLFFVWLIVRRKKAKMASQAELAAETPEIEKPE